MRQATIGTLVMTLLVGCGTVVPVDPSIEQHSACVAQMQERFGEPDIRAVGENVRAEQWLWFGDPEQEDGVDRLVEFAWDSCEIQVDETLPLEPGMDFGAYLVGCRMDMVYSLEEHGTPDEVRWYVADYGDQQTWDRPNAQQPMRTVYQWGPGVDGHCFSSGTMGIDWW